MRVWKKLALVSTGASVLGILLWQMTGPLQVNKQTLDHNSHSLASYEVSVTVKQDRDGQNPQPNLVLKGELQQILLADGEFRTQWSRIDTLNMMGQDENSSREAMMAYPIYSAFKADRAQFEHRSESASMLVIESLQANLLNKMLLPIQADTPLTLTGTRQETDELGTFTASYSSQEQAGGYLVEKRWVSYTTGLIVDSQHDSLVYALDKTGRLIELGGQLGLKVQDIYYVNEISIKLLSNEAPPAELIKQPRMQNLKTLASNPQQDSAQVSTDFETVLNQFDALSETTASTRVYQIFSILKQDLNSHPQHGDELAARIRATTARDPSSKRRLTVLFGALAQSNHEQHADLLGELVKQCGDSFCKIQALVGLSDHKFPTEASAGPVLELASNRADPELQATALLAAGSLGQKLASGLTQLPGLFMSQLNDPQLAEMKSTVLAAMGNHGRAEYLPILSSYLEAKDLNQRIAAVYSMRYLPGAEAILLNLLSPTQDKVLITEAYKALAYQALSKKSFEAMTARSLALDEEDLQITAARSLVQANEQDSESTRESLEVFKAQTRFAGVRSYIESATQTESPAP